YETFICSSAWTAPAGVTEATVEAWGGGGGGYGRSEDTSAVHRGAGGGGGAYAQSTLTVTPGDSYTVTVGQGGPAAPQGNPDFGDGEPSVFGENLVVAAGGQGAGQTTGGGNSVGGSVANSVGQIRCAGGSG